jgi:GMP synthase-like glutamine amidotransferase
VLVARKVLFIVNDPVAPAGLLGEAFADNGFDVETFEVVPWDRVDDPAVDVTFPDAAGYRVIVPLGARWPVYDDALRRSWVGAEIRLLHDAHRHGVAVLGVCFGGQLLAAAHGGSVTRSTAPELGWCDLDTDDPALVPPGPWFQWHFDRWTLPPGATEISRNPQASQAFLLRRNLALQFHPELDRALLLRWIADDRDRDIETLDIDEGELITRTAELEDSARHRVHRLVRGFIARVGGR